MSEPAARPALAMEAAAASPSGDGETVGLPVPPAGEIAPVAAAADTGRSDLSWAIANPRQALAALPLGVPVGLGLLAYVGHELWVGDARWSLLVWAMWAGICIARAVMGEGVFERGDGDAGDGPDAPDEVRWIELDRPLIGLPVRILAGVFGSAILLLDLYILVALTSADDDAGALLSLLAIGIVGGLFVFAAVKGGTKARELAPPVPHPAYLGRAAAAPLLPANLGTGQDLPVDSAAGPEPARHRPIG